MAYRRPNARGHVRPVQRIAIAQVQTVGAQHASVLSLRSAERRDDHVVIRDDLTTVVDVERDHLTVRSFANDLDPIDRNGRPIRQLDRLSADEMYEAVPFLLRRLDVMPVRRHPDGLGLLTLDDQPPPGGFELPFVSATLREDFTAPRSDLGREQGLITALIPQSVICDTHDDVWERVRRRRLRAVDEDLFQGVGRGADLLLHLVEHLEVVVEHHP